MRQLFQIVTTVFILRHYLGRGVASAALDVDTGEDDRATAPNHERRATSVDPRKFSGAWWNAYFHSGSVGCQEQGGLPRVVRWRGSNWGENLNGLVMAWTDSIVVGNGDVALVIEPEGRELSGQCRAGADEAAADASGWASFFAPMSHLCVFSSQLELNAFVATRGINLPVDERQEPGPIDGGGAGDQHHAWGQDPDIRSAVEAEAAVRSALQGTATDLFRAMSRVLHHLLSHVQPRLQGDVRSALREQAGGFFSDETKAVKYVGMFVRETEGRAMGSFRATETLDCFERVSKYLEDVDKDAAGYILASEVSGIALVSEDATALAEAKKIVRRYFRNVRSDDVVQLIAASSASPPIDAEADTPLSNHCGTPGYVGGGDELVQLLAQLELMARAHTFVGVASESFSWLVFLMRDALRIPRETSLSMDRKTAFPGRFSRSRR